MDRGAWRAAVHGVTKSRARQNNLHNSHVVLFCFSVDTQMLRSHCKEESFNQVLPLIYFMSKSLACLQQEPISSA